MSSDLTPFLGPHSPLDARAQKIVASLYEGEQRLMAALPTDDPRDPKRLRRVVLTRDEMLGQPQAIIATWENAADALAEAARDLAVRPIDRVVMTGCGDSLAVMIGARMFLEHALGVPCEPMQALDVAYYAGATLGPRTLVVALSSSGTTTRTVEALLLARARGAITLALSNTETSPLMAEADCKLPIRAERKGWPTQSSTASMALLCRLAAQIGVLRGAPGAGQALAALEGLPGIMAQVLAACDNPMAELAVQQADRTMFLYTGGGPAYAAALFGAVKMKECSPDHAFAIPLEEFHHYNSLKSGEPLFVLAPAGPSVARARDTADEGRRWGGRIFGFVTSDETALDGRCDAVFRLPPLHEHLAAFAFTLPLQLFAYHVAMEKFRRAGVDTTLFA